MLIVIQGWSRFYGSTLTYFEIIEVADEEDFLVHYMIVLL